MLLARRLRTLFVNDDASNPSGAANTRPLSAASGLVVLGCQMYVVADDETSLAIFDLNAEVPGRLWSLLDEVLPDAPKERKRAKPDFEALVWLPSCPALPQGGLLAFGSGSSERRQRAVLLQAPGQKGNLAVTKVIDLAPLFEPLWARFPELNIEGAFVDGERFCLLQRGHRRAPANACIAYSWEAIQKWIADTGAPPEVICVSHFELGCLEDVPLCFTDGAALPDGGWVFCAAAEDTSDSYQDGKCIGSAVGRVDASGRLVSLASLSVLCKAEGISVRVEGDSLYVLLVTDADDPKIPALLLGATLELKV